MLLKQKKIAEYQRVSSSGQELQMQESSNNQYLKEYDPLAIEKFIDYDVSATKIDFTKRPALNRMLNSIREGKISKVIVYERDRIARDVYEYIHVLKEIKKFNVEIIFTASNAPAYSNDLFIESMYGVLAQSEGQRIQTRLDDASKRNPPRLFGYDKFIENGKRFYRPNKKKSLINNLFVDFSKINNEEDLYEIIMNHKTLLKRSDFRLIKILKNPFYAGCYNTQGQYYPLEHVEPLIKIDLFIKVQEIINSFEKSINKAFNQTTEENKITPLCRTCNNPLNFKKGDFGKPNYYICKKHKIQISADDLNESIIKSNNMALQKLSYSKMNNICNKAINELISKENQRSETLQSTLETECIAISQNYSPKLKGKKVKEKLIQVEKHKNEINYIQGQIEFLIELKRKIKIVTEYSKEKIVNQIDESDHLFLSEVLISSISVDRDHIIVQHYFSEFWEGESDGS